MNLISLTAATPCSSAQPDPAKVLSLPDALQRTEAADLASGGNANDPCRGKVFPPTRSEASALLLFPGGRRVVGGCNAPPKGFPELNDM